MSAATSGSGDLDIERCFLRMLRLQELMAEPATLSDGFNYDRAALEMCALTECCHVLCALTIQISFQGTGCCLEQDAADCLHRHGGTAFMDEGRERGADITNDAAAGSAALL
jgi:hypothetical protein